MRIVQILPVIAFGDAIGNHVIALARFFSAHNYENKIYAEVIDSRLPKKIALNISKYKKKPEDIILYHMSTGSYLNRKILDYKVPVILNYHNITPANFFKEYSQATESLCTEAREDLMYLAGKVDGCISDSLYNQMELIKLGYQCPMDVIPILIPFEDYAQNPDIEGIKEYTDGYVNIIFVGRIVPNKRQEDLIEAFYYYKKYFDTKARLILIGTYAGVDGYAEKLKQYINWMKLEDVIFTGQVSFPKILAFYHSADLFLCMSEHEGFCVPLVEAMYFRVPIIAYDSTAIGDTLGGAGILLNKKNPLETAAMMDYLISHKDLCNIIKENQTERLKDFEHEKISGAFLKFLRAYAAGEKNT